jgi:hypothetical protein
VEAQGKMERVGQCSQEGVGWPRPNWAGLIVWAESFEKERKRRKRKTGQVTGMHLG